MSGEAHENDKKKDLNGRKEHNVTDFNLLSTADPYCFRCALLSEPGYHFIFDKE